MNTTAIGCDTDGWRFPPLGSQQSPPPACTVHCAHTADGIVELAVAGLFAAREALYLRHAIVQYLRTERVARAFVIDLRKALVLLEGDCVAWPTIDDAARVSMKPIAVVVAPEVETRFLLWTWEMASAGLARAAFVDRDEALGWVCSRARGLVER